MDRNDLKRADIMPVEGVDGTFVRTISGREYRAFQAACSASKNGEEEKNTEAVYRFVNLTACRADGSRFWSDTELAETEDLPITRARRIYDAAAALNGLTEKKAG